MVEALTGLSPLGFPFTLEGFPHKNLGVVLVVAWFYLFYLRAYFYKISNLICTKNGRKYFAMFFVFTLKKSDVGTNLPMGFIGNNQ